MSSEGSREAGGLETTKGAVRERIGLACQPWHSRMEGTIIERKKEKEEKGKVLAKTIRSREASFD